MSFNAMNVSAPVSASRLAGFSRTARALAALAFVVAFAVVGCATGSSPAPSVTASGLPSTPPPASSTEPGSAITVETPVEGAIVAVPFMANGTANTFEAALTIEVVDQAGMVMCVRQLTATSGSGTPGTWEGALAFAPEEDTLAVMFRAYAHSAKDGSVIDLVEYPISIATDRAPIILTSPSCGQVYEPGGLMLVTGTAALFEAALTVDVRDTAGVTVATLPVTADACCVESNFSSRLTLPDGIPGGLYDVVAYSRSAKDGSVENEFAVQIELRP